MIMISNFSNKPIHIKKLMHVDLGMDLPHWIVTLTEVENFETDNDIPHYKEN